MTFGDTVRKMRHYRIFGISSFEVTLVIIILILFIIILKYFKNPNVTQLFILSIAFLVLIFTTAIIVHYVFNFNTQLNYMLGLSSCKPDYDSLFGIFNC